MPAYGAVAALTRGLDDDTDACSDTPSFGTIQDRSAADRFPPAQQRCPPPASKDGRARPYRIVRSNMSRTPSLSLLSLLRLGLFAVAILPFLGLQFGSLRRLHGKEGDESSPPLRFGEPQASGLRPSTEEQNDHHQSLLDRIHDETRRSRQTPPTGGKGTADTAAPPGVRLSPFATTTTTTSATGDSVRVRTTRARGSAVVPMAGPGPLGTVPVPGLLPPSIVSTSAMVGTDLASSNGGGSNQVRRTRTSARAGSIPNDSWHVPVLAAGTGVGTGPKPSGSPGRDRVRWEGGSGYPDSRSGEGRPGGYKIVAFADFNYKELAVKWYQRLSDLGYAEHTIVVYDEATADFLQTLNDHHQQGNQKSHGTDLDGAKSNASDDSRYYYRFEKHFLPPPPEKLARIKKRTKRQRKAREQLFAWRWHYLLDQLRGGTSILLMDVDALVNRYLDIGGGERASEDNSNGNGNGNDTSSGDEEYLSTGDTDNETDTETDTETNAVDRTGGRVDDFWRYDVLHAYEREFTVNGGMSWLRATNSTVAFVELLVEKCGTMCDDQIVLNELLGLDDDNAEAHRGTGGLRMEWGASHPSTGRSAVTGHSVKIWERDFVFRGVVAADSNVNGETKPPKCPPKERNWISMPRIDDHNVVVNFLDQLPPIHTSNRLRKPKVRKRKHRLTRASSHMYKLALYDVWDTYCGYSPTDSLAVSKKQ